MIGKLQQNGDLVEGKSITRRLTHCCYEHTEGAESQKSKTNGSMINVRVPILSVNTNILIVLEVNTEFVQDCK